jgi:hypothetical protein
MEHQAVHDVRCSDLGNLAGAVRDVATAVDAYAPLLASLGG